MLADRYQGVRFNSPNDLTIDSKGRIYFSDPRYGPRDDMEMRDQHGLQVEGIYRIDAPGKVTRVIGHEVNRANGVLVFVPTAQAFQQLPALMVLQTPIGSLPLQQLADRARDLGTGARLKTDFCHAISVFL